MKEDQRVTFLLEVRHVIYAVKAIRNMVTCRKDSIYTHNFNHYLCIDDYFMPVDYTPWLLSTLPAHCNLDSLQTLQSQHPDLSFLSPHLHITLCFLAPIQELKPDF